MTKQGIRQRGSSFLVDITVNGMRRTRTCTTYDEAVVERLKMEAELREGVAAQQAATSWTMSKALSVTTEVRWSDTRNGTKAIACATEAAKFFGADTPLESITVERIDDYVRHLRTRERNAPATINRKLAALSALLTDAMERDGLAKKPRIIRQPEPNHRIRYISAEEEMMLLSLFQQWQQPAVREAVITLLDSGMRVGELLSAQTRDVDVKANIISIWQNKGDLPRSVPMTDRVRQIVTTRCERSRGLVFFDLSRETLRYYWDRARSAMGLDEDDQFVPHCLRHTCATRLVQNGVSIFVVQKILGHRSITVTERYSHLSDNELRNAINTLQGTVVPGAQPVADVAGLVADTASSKTQASPATH